MNNELIFQRRVAFPSPGSENWPQYLLEYIVTRLIDEGFSGAVYAELTDPTKPIEILFSSECELMLTKKNKAEVIGRLDLARFTKFISYLIRDVLQFESGAVASGVVDISLENCDERHFAISARRSSSIGCYFQIDQFFSHL